MDDFANSEELLGLLSQHSDCPQLTKEHTFLLTVEFLRREEMLKIYPISDLRHDYD